MHAKIARSDFCHPWESHSREARAYFIRSLTCSSAVLAQIASLSPPGAPLTPIAPMTSSPALITTPPALSSRWGTLANALDTAPVFERSTRSAVSVPKLAAESGRAD